MAKSAPVLVLVGTLATGCSALELDVAIEVLLPADDSDLTRTNNVSLTVEPLGTVESFNADGLDFSVSLSLEPQNTPQTVSLFMADDETLLAWGRSAPVSLAGSGSGAALLVTRPDVLSSFDVSFDAPDADALAAPLADIGMLVLAADGTAVFLDVRGWELQGVSAIDTDAVLDPTDGVLVADTAGGVQRVGTREGLSVQRFDPLQDVWTTRTPSDEDVARFDQRPDAAIVQTDPDTLWVLGGGDHLDVVSVSLDIEATELATLADTPPLDAPRPGAVPIVVHRGDDSPSSTVLFGADDDRPVTWLVERGEAHGPAGPWTGAACATLDPPEPDVPIRVLCMGGLRNRSPTGDAVLLTLRPDGDTDPPEVTEYPDLLAGPMAEPLALPAASAVYAQGDGRAMHIALEGLTAAPSVHSPTRATGGSVAALPLGVTFVVGGASADGTPLARWSTFMPSPG